MATPNYGYEKRQKELAKKRKKEDKLRAKADRKISGPEESAEPDGTTDASRSTEDVTSPGAPQN